MSTFADFTIEFGSRRSAEETLPGLPFRGSPWTNVPGDFGLSRLLLSTPRLAGLTENSAGLWTTWTVGEVGSYRDTNGKTSTCVNRFLNDLQNGTARAETLGGRFLILGWSAQTRRWNIWTDRMGGVQAYFVEGSEGAALGTYSPAIYSYSRRNLDWIGLSSFFSLGFFIGDRTHYEDCKILRPASRYEYDASGKLVGHAAYWQWQHTPDKGRNETDTIAEFADRFAKVVDHQTSDCRVALPLSGGLDSRTVAACLPGDRQVSAYSYGYNDDSVETAISREVAEAAGLSFHGHTIRPYLFEKLGLVLQSVEGFQDVTQSRQADMSEWLNQQSDYVIGAHWGDVLCDDMGIDHSMTPAEQLGKLECKMRKKGGDWLLQNLCSKQVNGKSADQLVREDLKKEWESHAGIEDPDFRAKAVKSTQWAFRWTLPSIRMYQPGAMPRLPFLEPSILDFFSTVPTTMVLGRRLQIEYLKRFAPRLARVRWQAYDADLYNYQHFGTWQLPKRAWKALQRAVTPQKKYRRNWEVQFQPPGQPEKLESLLCAKGLFLHEVIDAATVRAEFEKFTQSPDASNGYIISMLLTFSSWAESVHVGSRPL